MPSKLFCDSEENRFIESLPFMFLELLSTILFNEQLLRDIFKVFCYISCKWQEKRKLLRLISWVISESAILRCLKHLRKFQRKQPWWSIFVSKIKKNILPQMFSQKFPQIFQNNNFLEHFRLAVSLIL